MARKRGTITTVNAGTIDIKDDVTLEMYTADTRRDWREEQIVEFFGGSGFHPVTEFKLATDVQLGFTADVPVA